MATVFSSTGNHSCNLPPSDKVEAMRANPQVLETVLKACRMQFTSHPPKFNRTVDLVSSGVSAQAEEISVLSHSRRRSPSGFLLLVPLHKNGKGPWSILDLCVLNRYLKWYRLRMLALTVLSYHTSRQLVHFNQPCIENFSGSTNMQQINFGLYLGGLSLRAFTKCMEELWNFWGTLLRISWWLGVPQTSPLLSHRGAGIRTSSFQIVTRSVSQRKLITSDWSITDSEEGEGGVHECWPVNVSIDAPGQPHLFQQSTSSLV